MSQPLRKSALLTSMVSHPVPTRAPFSLPQALTFIRRFPANRDEFVIGEDSITAAITIGTRAIAFTVREKPGTGPGFRRPTGGQADRGSGLEIEAPDDVPASAIVPRVSTWLGADHDLAPFYAIAESDKPFAPLIRELYGLHHVAFMSLAEIAVYCVMMQRAPISIASRMKARFVDRFGLRVKVGDRELRSMPDLPALAKLDGDEIADAIKHSVKGPKIATVVKGVAAIGEEFLRSQPYEKAHEALLEIPGVGPFSAGAILLRGLGRMEGLPAGVADEEARTIYGRSYSRAAIEKRYGAHIGYWSFYIKTGVARQSH